MKKHRFTIIATILALVAAIVTWQLYNPTPQQNDTKTSPTKIVRIGAILPLTDTYAYYGTNESLGLRLALEDVKNEFKQSEINIELLLEDSKAAPKIGVTAANKLISQQNARFIITSLTGVSRAVSPLVIEAGAAQVMFTMDESLADLKNGIIRIYPGIREEGHALVRAIVEASVKSCDIVHFEQAAINGQVRDVLLPEFSARSITTSRIEPFRTTTPLSLSAIAATIKDTGSDCLVVNAYYSQLPVVLKILHEHGALDGKKIFSGFNLGVAAISKMLPEGLPVITTAMPAGYSRNTKTERFRTLSARAASEGQKLSIDVVYAYDAMRMLCRAIHNTGGDPKAVAAALTQMSYPNSVSGISGIDATGSSVTAWETLFIKSNFIMTDEQE
ncbi:MAG: hypothetical protein BBJ57_06385 [Desulfobacterales bacterium PC51MH44]|nr:MAG: hypothetical protein BBJ57_06385 [Desulfobacterales bacterium PC51MH44]